MNANRNHGLSHFLFAALAIVSCANPFAGALQAQSSSGVPAPLHAFPDNNDTQPEGPASTTARWPAPGAREGTNRVPDMKCEVVEWLAGPPKPSLVVVCPPEEVFAPLRLYFKLSWKRDEDIPGNFQTFIAQPKTQTKMHWTMQGDYHVLLKAERKNGRGSHAEWIHFTDLAAVYIKY